MTFNLSENLIYLLFSQEGFSKVVKRFVNVREGTYQG